MLCIVLPGGPWWRWRGRGFEARAAGGAPGPPPDPDLVVPLGPTPACGPAVDVVDPVLEPLPEPQAARAIATAIAGNDAAIRTPAVAGRRLTVP
ncbi:MAG TPA: hypothetical protein VHR37_03485 [Solirubrobacterales bacterium]|nr:hypothetical protein [Solirubrobacterales bacterium]